MPVVELCNGQKGNSCVTASHAAESAGKALLWKKSLWDDLFTLWGWVCKSGLLSHPRAGALPPQEISLGTWFPGTDQRPVSLG